MRASYEAALETVRALGGELVEAKLEFSLTPHALAAYYLIAPAEASANLARYDGVRYGLRVPGDDVFEMYDATRQRGFGREVKRRCLIGAYALSAGYYDAYYGQAQRVRTLIRRDFEQAFEKLRPAAHADLADGRVPHRRAGRRPARDVRLRPLHAAGQPLRAAGDLAALRSLGGTAGRPAPGRARPSARTGCWPPRTRSRARSRSIRRPPALMGAA